MIPIITIIAIVLVVRWALSSPTVETLVTVNIGIGIAALGGLLQAIALIISTINNATNSVREDIRGGMDSVREDIRRSTDRIIEAVESRK